MLERPGLAKRTKYCCLNPTLWPPMSPHDGGGSVNHLFYQEAGVGLARLARKGTSPYGNLQRG